MPAGIISKIHWLAGNKVRCHLFTVRCGSEGEHHAGVGTCLLHCFL